MVPTTIRLFIRVIVEFVGLCPHRHYTEPKTALRQGEVALSYVLWYSVGRFFIEGMRTDSLWIGEWIRVSQALSLALFIGAIVVWFIRRQDYPPISYYSDGNKGQKKTIKMVN